MDEKQAKEKLDEFLDRVKKGLYSPDYWKEATFGLTQLPNGDWLATPPQIPKEGILLKADGPSVPFHGALGSFVPRLGYPLTGEFLLGSARRGRYQFYKSGLAIWEQFKNDNDLGYPVASWNSHEERAQKCCALVAFFDLRGFTKWSTTPGISSREIQDVVWNFELAFQDAFSGNWCKFLFTKGTGDGFMIVSEEGWYEPTKPLTFSDGHGKDFCRACATTISNARKSLPAELAIGCGIAVGEITQLYVLGRPDYIGPAVNEASKIQSVTYDEICMTEAVLDCLKADGIILAGIPLPGKGYRVATENVQAECAISKTI